MAFYLVQSDSKLFKVDTAGGAVELALPAGVTMSAARRARFAILDRTILMTTAPSVNLLIDANLNITILAPRTPSVAPSVAAGAAGVLIGSFRYVYTYAIMSGTVVKSESGPSDASLDLSLNSQQGSLSNIGVSTDPGVNARRIYRTLNGGNLFFLVGTIADNATTVFTDNMTDEEASASEELDEDLGGPPGTTPADYIEEITVWKDRAWALTHNKPDRAYFSGNGVPWAWSELNYLPVKPVGADLAGGTAFAKRRDELGIGKRRRLMKVIGQGDEDGDGVVDFEIIGISEEVGIWSPESVVIIRDHAFFQAEDGVYRWGPDGVVPLSRDSVHPWFTNDDTFNRAMFPYSFGSYNQARDGYQLFLAPAGSEAFTHWVLYDLKLGKWFGPHKTSGLVPTCANVFEDNDGLVVPVLGAADGIIYKMNQAAFRDGAAAIDMRVLGKHHSQADPESTKYWGWMSVFTKAESAGALTVRAYVGGLDATQGPVPVTTMARVGSVVSVTTATNHLFADGGEIIITGAVETDYNGTWPIVVTGDTAFSFDIGLLVPTSPATGTIEALDPLRADMSHDLTLARERLRQQGVGQLCAVEFQQATIDQPCEIYGYEIDPVVDIGRR